MQLILHSHFTLYCLTVQTYAAALKFIVNKNREHIIENNTTVWWINISLHRKK